MGVYLQLIRFYLRRFQTYPLELISSVARNIISIVFLVVFWSLIVSESSQEDTLRGLLSYFLIARGVSDLVMAEKTSLGKLLRESIKHSEITSWMLRPLSLLPAMYAVTAGKNGITFMVAALNIVVGLVIHPPLSAFGFIAFVYFFICAAFISFAFNTVEGVLALKFTEAQGIKNALAHTTRILSGAMVPLTYFPEGLRTIIEFLPFSSMVFGPVQAFSVTAVTSDVLKSAFVALAWAIGLNTIVLVLWRRSMKMYEAIGL